MLKNRKGFWFDLEISHLNLSDTYDSILFQSRILRAYRSPNLYYNSLRLVMIKINFLEI